MDDDGRDAQRTISCYLISRAFIYVLKAYNNNQ